MKKMQRQGTVFLIVVTILLSACKATPSEEFITQKDTERMIEQAIPTQSGTAVNDLGIPEQNVTFETTDTSGNVQIHVDANVFVPSESYLPVARISMRDFTKQDVETLYNALCSDAVPVSDDSGFPKRYYQKQIDKLMQMRETGNLDKYDTVEEIDVAIAELIDQMNQAPETATAIEPRFEFTAYDDGASDINLFCVRNDSMVSRLIVFNASDGVGGGYAEYIRDIQQTAAFSRLVSAGTGVASAFAETLSPEFIQPKISLQQAKGMAEELIANLGLADFACTGERLMPLNNPHIEIGDEDGSGLYEFMFTRSINGVGITYTNDDMTSTPDSADSVAKPVRYEKIRVFVDDEGVFAVRWNGPCSAEEIVSEETTLLSFTDIMSCFEKMIAVKNEGIVSWDGSPVKKEIDVTKITLGLMRVVEKDNYETAVIVPVWDFFGTEARQDSTTVSGMDGYESLLTISAIDGSVIDRSLGY
ncbi:MAG TPA: DUF6034 family protein [Clostridia bacterium]|nr:DUF6034 family protein [Clostridia bacterium]